MNGPLPSRRAFLSNLAALPADSKVRFLGCVRTYSVPTGRLILEHNYPRRKSTSDVPTVSVDINAVLETVTSEELRVGAWVNVLGYVRRSMIAGETIYVEAIMVFAAGAIALGEYERILHESMEVERRVQRPT
ncbi:hypothetical protein P170DRAFT_511551 [Aspergillus steynii IBT 23096]|uniref:CST complex subunit Ten1 n=1 Tax=Aspergillus steynii IBT 23096 TaxID=1392250 RepID=A0A2I2G1W8_9EURO|nr:uncharacterized protein P170DRAFT_511551 [Aspergillus steynii IBT 23096]PLB46882.1 hypothetical protein P170DRAFT_511551 [Aspergillus steynii IBT 23096]